MRKSILIGVLAALMLFAFTACENGAPTSPLYGKEIQGVSPVSAPDYVAGEKIDPSAITLRVNFNDNTYAEFKGSELGMKLDTALVAGSNAATVTVAGQEYVVNVNAYAVEGFNVDFSTIKAETVIIDSTTEVSTDGATIDVVYNGGKTKEAVKAIIDSDSVLSEFATLPIAAFGITGWEDVKDGQTFTFTVPAANASSTDPDSGLTYTFTGSKTVTAKIAEVGTYTTPVIKQTNEVFTVAADSDDASKNTLAKVEYDVSFSVTKEGKTIPVTFKSTALGDWSVSFPGKYAAGYKLTKSTETIEVVFTNATDYPGLEVKGELTVTTTADYPLNITVAEAEGKDKETYAAGALVPASNFSFTATGAWASGKTYADDEAKKNELSSSLFEADNIKKLTADTEDKSYMVQFEYKTAPGKGTININEIGVQIKN